MSEFTTSRPLFLISPFSFLLYRAFLLFFLFCLAHDDAVEVATEEVAGGDCQPEGKYLGQVGKGEVHRYAQIEERICHTMGEAAIDEDGYAKEHWQVLAFASKGDNGGHYETAANGEDATLDGT